MVLAAPEPATEVPLRYEYTFGGQPVFTMGSYLPTVQGDELGVGVGLISGVNLGACRPVEHSKSVRIEGQWLVRHSDLMVMNWERKGWKERDTHFVCTLFAMPCAPRLLIWQAK
ncbi:PAAR-like domain-containing protein [Candidatus Thiosymbion oneisti]|uniref:PAAR-like domain-containing protein n=1 Tax=Candidatus Thiosymbion oneisti TaxID=589554 RepID=UPI000B7CE8C1